MPDGAPYNARFGDRYRNEDGGLDQATHVFLGGCGLPAAWADTPQWRILETGFGFGLNFLVTWAAWKADPQRTRLLHFVSVEAFPVSREDLLQSLCLRMSRCAHWACNWPSSGGGCCQACTACLLRAAKCC